MSHQKIYIALSTFASQGPEPLKILERQGFVLGQNSTGRRLTRDEIIQGAQGFNGIIAGVEPYDSGVLDNLAMLQCISRCGVGVDNIDLKKAHEKNIKVLNTPEVVIQPVAEMTIAMIFDLLRKLTAQTVLLRARKWEKLTGNLLAGKKVGVVGLGRIGRRVAELLRAWHIEVQGVDISPDKEWAQARGVELVDLPKALMDCDIITLHVANSLSHPFYLDAPTIAKMKQGAYLINVARGGLIDEEALVLALKNGHLSGAALDVFKEEPYTGPLCDLDNVILTPHVATLTQESRLAMEIEAAQNIVNFFNK